MTPRVAGIDLSLTATGIARPDGSSALVAVKATGPERMCAVWERIEPVALASDLVVIEGLSYASKGGQSHDQIPGLWWYVTTHLWSCGRSYVVVPPTSLKKYACGKGSGVDKADMRMSWFRRTGQDVRDDNQVDALWLRAMGLDHLGHPMFAVPSVNREALAKVQWPDQEA